MRGDCAPLSNGRRLKRCAHSPLAILVASAAAAPARAQGQSSAIERVETPDGTVTIVRPARRPPPPATAPQTRSIRRPRRSPPAATIDRGTRRQEAPHDTLPHAGSAAPDIVIIQQRRRATRRRSRRRRSTPGWARCPRCAPMSRRCPSRGGPCRRRAAPTARSTPSSSAAERTPQPARPGPRHVALAGELGERQQRDVVARAAQPRRRLPPDQMRGLVRPPPARDRRRGAAPASRDRRPGGAPSRSMPADRCGCSEAARAGAQGPGPAAPRGCMRRHCTTIAPAQGPSRRRPAGQAAGRESARAAPRRRCPRDRPRRRGSARAAGRRGAGGARRSVP